MKASDRQVSGSHYKSYAIQPAEFIQRNNLNWCEGNAIKYLVRHRDKKGAEDLLKARHYIDLLLEWEYGGTAEKLPVNTAAPCSEPSLCDTCHDEECEVSGIMAEHGTCNRYNPGPARISRKASLCHSCHQEESCTKEQIVACEESDTCPRYVSALRENMLDAKQETSGPEQIGQNCDTAWCVHYSQLFLRNCQKYGSEEIKGCAYYHKTPETKQEAPTSAVLPSTHTDPSTNCKDCFNAACVGKGRDLTCDQGCERFMSKEIAR